MYISFYMAASAMCIALVVFYIAGTVVDLSGVAARPAMHLQNLL